MKQFMAWSDGSCDNLNPLRPGGAAYIIFDKYGKEIKRASKGFMGTSNNRMENLAVISIVNSLPEKSAVTIHTDSQYCIKAFTGKNPKANLDQIALYKKIVFDKHIFVTFKWIRGHDGNEYNELCDRMARREYSKMLNESEELYDGQITTKGKRRYKGKNKR